MSLLSEPNIVLAPFPKYQQLWLALSGGLDSVVLLDLVVRYCQQQNQDLNVIHIHHGLSANADQWALHCQQLCENYQTRFGINIECQVHRVQLDTSGNIEAQARQARYQVFSDALQQEDLILMAHHSDDQAETLLLRLMRGAGSQGLAGMPQQRTLGQGRLFRPLLNYSRQQLEEYAHQQQLSWVEDESNVSLEFDRNYLRHQVMPLLKQRWPSTNRVLSRVGQNLSDAAELNRDLAELDLEKVCHGEKSLCCQALVELTQVRQTNLLRHWLQKGGMPELEQKQWQVIFTEIVAAREDAEPCFDWGGYQLRRFRNRLYLLKPSRSKSDLLTSSQDHVSLNQSSTCIDISKGYRLSGLPLSTASIHLVLPGGEWSLQSLSRQLSQQRDKAEFELGANSSNKVRLKLPDSGHLELRYRQGGEKICLPKRGTKALKKLLQEADIPPWQRQQLPLLWWVSTDGKEHLIAVADLWFDRGFVMPDISPEFSPDIAQGVSQEHGQAWQVCWKAD